jgi:hypothetical protein
VRVPLDIKGDAEAVPGVDAGDGEGQVDEVLVVEVFVDGSVVGVGGVGGLDVRDRVGPGQRGAFAGREGVGGLPVGEGLDAGLGLVVLLEFRGVRADAEGAAVEQLGAEVDEVEECGFEGGGGVDGVAYGGEGRVGVGGEFGVAETGHRSSRIEPVLRRGQRG